MVMDAKDKQRLKEVLREEQQSNDAMIAGRDTPHNAYICDTFIDEDSSQWYTAPYELEKFGIDPRYISALTTAYHAFYEFTGVLDQYLDHNPELLRLLILYRDEFKRLDVKGFYTDHFVKMCRDFFDVPEASARGYFDKREYNLRFVTEGSGAKRPTFDDKPNPNCDLPF